VTDPNPPLPAPIDRAALERILQRAAELQAQDHDVGEGLSTEEVLALGKEVGIPVHLLRQAMLEEQSRIVARSPQGLADELFGPGEVVAGRVVRGSTQAAELTLLDWMDKNELLVLQRQLPGRLSWERMTGVQAAMRRGISTFEGARARFMLTRADVVRATITPLEEGYCHVALSASLKDARTAVLAGAGVVSGMGAVGAGVLVALHAIWFLPLAPLVGGAALGWAVSRRHRPTVERVQLGLERALDYVEVSAVKPAHELPPAKPPSLLEYITGEVRRAITSANYPRPDRYPRKR
jgi:exosome complex RNA-binding protein Csl4